MHTKNGIQKIDLKKPIIKHIIVPQKAKLKSGLESLNSLTLTDFSAFSK